MTCRDFIEFLWKYVHGELSSDERATFDAHLGVCPDCVAYLSSYERTIKLEKEAMADATDSSVGADVPEELIQAILATRARTRD